ncbi:MAG: potassium-transporting ATPase subunit KdpC [Deltaproteobacteria bacterium]|nr:potassium-transporting ATPase subunit KdpC [Deltaproteobacteria bacterium]
MKTILRPALTLLLLFTLLLGVGYPALVTAFAQAIFPRQANGSLVESGGRPVGSELIGQSFVDPAYFWSRPSATSGVPYDGRASTGSNLGPSNPGLHERVAARVAALRAADPDNRVPVPVDLVTASASGLDPHISPAAAYWQVPRVARARGVSEEVVRRLVAGHVQERWAGFLGEPRVNVLELNLALDRIAERVSANAGASAPDPDGRKPPMDTDGHR